MLKTRQAKPDRGHLEQHAADGPYVPCGGCARCLTGAGRDVDPTASDCWAAHLDAATRRSA